jgi:hypothetical protein
MFRHSLLIVFNDASELSLLGREALFCALPPMRSAFAQLLHHNIQAKHVRSMSCTVSIEATVCAT